MENVDCPGYIISPELCPESALWRTVDGDFNWRDDKDLKVVCGMLSRLPLAYICIRLLVIDNKFVYNKMIFFYVIYLSPSTNETSTKNTVTLTVSGSPPKGSWTINERHYQHSDIEVNLISKLIRILGFILFF